MDCGYLGIIRYRDKFFFLEIKETKEGYLLIIGREKLIRKIKYSTLNNLIFDLSLILKKIGTLHIEEMKSEKHIKRKIDDMLEALRLEAEYELKRKNSK